MGAPPQADAVRWYCVYSQPRKEFVAIERLQQQSYTCFLPTITRTVQHARKASHKAMALFPSYLFVHLNVDEQSWRPIRSTVGVADLVLQDDRPLPVPIGVVERLLAVVNVDGLVDFRDDLNVGDDVRMLSGPFFNLVGRLQHLDARGRVRVLLSILGGERVVSADRMALQRVTA